MADRTSLARATEASDSPTPGYLYLDIAKSAAANPAACAETATYLTRRLSTKSNHNVKYKCLKVITQISISPVTRGQFKRTIAQDPSAMGAIKEALNFRGPPDAIRGDEIYVRVRTAAKEALDSIYSDDPSSSVSYSGGGGVASSYGGGGGVGYASNGGGGPRMEGIGNPMFKDPRSEPSGGIGSMTIGEVAAVAGETIVGMIKDPLARNVPDQTQQRSSGMQGFGGGGYGGGGYGGSSRGYSGTAPPFAAEIARATGGEYSGASNRGPNAVVPNNYDRDSSYYKKPSTYDWAKQSSTSSGPAPPAPSGVGGSWGAAPSGPIGGPSVASQARQPPMQSRQAQYGGPQHSGTIGSATGGVAASDGTYEKNLITDLCPPGGMKAEPPPDKLASFVRSVPSLNSDLVCPVLLDCLEDGQPWIIKAKALCVIVATIRAAQDAALANGAADGANAYSDFFHACSEEIEPLASHPRMAVRDPARQILKSIGLEFTENNGVSGVSSGTSTGRSNAAPLPAVAPVEPPNLLDFGDDDNTLTVNTATPAAQVQVSSTGGNSLFGGLTTKQAPVTAEALASQHQTPSPDNVELLLGDPEPSSASFTSKTSDGGLFGDVTVKVDTVSTGDKGSVQDVANIATNSGSAFGFINSNDVPNTAAQAPSSSKSLFDPLEGLGTVSSHQDANASQTSAQMQAMAYQQNMMMMQQQMQQMQMAMAMQHQQMGSGGSGGANMMRQSVAAHPGHLVNPNVMSAHLMKQAPGRGSATSSFSFLDINSSGSAKKEEIKSFDFVKDAMKGAK